MEIFEPLGDLIDYVSNVNILEDALSNHVVQICLHKLEYEVNISIIVSLDGIVELYYVDVVDLPKDLDFSVCPLSIRCVLEGVEYFFEGKYFFGMFFLDLPDVPICSRADLFEYIKSSMNVFLDVTGLILIAHEIWT